MCNRTAFAEPEDAGDAPVFVDYSGWQFNFYKSERT